MKSIFKISRIFLLLAGAEILAGCGKDILPGTVLDRSIVPIVSGSEMTKAGEGEQTVANLQGPEGFKMDIIADQDYTGGSKGLFEGVRRTVTYSGGQWSISGNPKWINLIPMSFWAYNNDVVNFCDFSTPAAGATQVHFSYPKGSSTADGRTDLLFAFANRTHDGSNDHASGTVGEDNIELNFKHAMSKICFDTDPVAGLPDGYKITVISINGLKTSGEADFKNDGTFTTWSNLSGSSNFSYSSPTDARGGDFIVIPQSLTGDMEIKLEKDGEAPIFLSAGLGGYTMQSGKKYIYRIKVTEGRQLTLTMNVLDWGLDARDIQFKPQNVTKFLSYDGDHAYIQTPYFDSEENNWVGQIFVKNGQPVRGSFKVIEPKGAKIHLSLDGNLNEFKVEPKSVLIDGTSDVEFTITPLVDDPKIDYQTRLHIYLIKADGKVINIDKDVMKENHGGDVYTHYTIVLPRQ